MKSYAISCLGCKVNTFEAQSIMSSLNELGYYEVDFKEKADIYCIFTCAVTNVATSKSRQKIRQAIAANPDAIICAVGCYVQISADQLQQEERIDILVGSDSKLKLPQLIQQVINKRERIITVQDVRKEAKFESLKVNRFSHKARAYLKIQDGCNQFCSYCIIPYARGMERSLNIDEAVAQARELAKNHSEIVLAGIHTGRYNSEKGEGLVELITRICEQTEVKRLRISSIEMNEITDELIELMKTNDKLARHLHIPLQSAHNRILKEMNRPYTIEEFEQLVNKVREAIPNISISTDVIVGFPQETDEDFNQIKERIERMKFSFLHVFPYSAKEGTPAAKMKNQVMSQVKKNRVKILMELSATLKVAFASKFIQKPMQCLIEKCQDGISSGYTSEYNHLSIEGEYEVNQIIDVIGSHMIDYELVGKEG